MRRAWTTVGLALGLCVGAACSSGMSSLPPYERQPFEGEEEGDEAETDDDDTGIDLDGGGPPPPGDDDGGVPPPKHHGDCCEGNGSPGCDNAPVEQCVCDSDPWCCESEWDEACAALIEPLGCGHCSDAPPPSGDEPTGGACCSAHPEPGCDDPAVEACVCDVDPQCCAAQWSAGCTAILELYDCGSCEGDPPPPPGGDTGGDPPPPPGGDTGGDAPPPGGSGDCCTSNGTPGCDDATLEACVCMQDEYCCNTAWDAVCVDQVGSLGCGTCEAGGGSGGSEGGSPSACCEQQPGAGCPDDAVEACVCAVDDYCCSVFWDLTCVGEVESLSCGTCS